MNVLETHRRVANAALQQEAGDAARYRSILRTVGGQAFAPAIVSTSEHTAPFNRASTLSFVVPQLALASLPREESTERRIELVCGGLIPFDNSHLPRCFLIPPIRHTRRVRRVHLVTQRMAKTSPLLVGPIAPEEIRGLGELLTAYPWLAPVMSRHETFANAAEQLAAIMETLLDRIAPEGTRCHVSVLESTAKEILLALLASRDPALMSLLFDIENRAEIRRALDGVACAWSDNAGSFLFWGNRSGKIVPLREIDGCLRGPHGFSVAIERPAIEDALRRGCLYPGVFLSLLAVSYFPGIPVSGGPRQLAYYEAMIDAANRCLPIARRSRSLSLPGYAHFDVTEITPRAGDPRRIPDFGAGIELAHRGLDGRFVAEQIARIPARTYGSTEARLGRSMEVST